MRTYITKEQAIAICGGRRNLLPTNKSRQLQLNDPSHRCYIGQTSNGRFYTEMTDIFGRVWPFPHTELCRVCGQPDSCGDCNHHQLSETEAQALIS